MNKIKAAGLIFAVTFVVLAVFIQPASANPSTRIDSLYAYIGDQYDTVEGGYSLKAETLSRVEPTFAALEAYNIFGDLSSRPPVINLTDTKDFISRTQWILISEDKDNYGGFSSFIAGNPEVQASYFAIRAWQILELQNDYIGMTNVDINETAMLVFLNRTFTDDGGFAQTVGGKANILATYQALYVMDYMATRIEEEDNIPYATTMTKWLNKTAVIEYILSCREGDAFMSTPDSKIAGVTPTAAALLSMDILKSLTTVANTQGIRDWLLARQVITPIAEEYVGGFTEGYLTNDTNLVSTYYALEGLKLLNALDSVNSSIATDFIINCQAADGSWALTPNNEEGETTYIGYAMQALSMLNGDNVKTLLSVEDPNNPAPPLIDWRVLLVVVIFVLAAIAGVVALRLD
ncbi:MAG: prenyltransferase/squalene oxidase repeat-containing protein [Candidatus Thorarchaeota archaeon]